MTDDLVPQALRQEWIARGWCPGEDVFSLFKKRVEEHPDKAAVIDDAGTTSYGRLLQEAMQVAKALLAEGVQAGDVVGICLPNRHETCAVELGAAAVGAASVAFPIMSREREARTLLGRSRAVTCVTVRSHGGFDHGELVHGLTAELPDLRSCFVLGGAVPGCVSLDAVLASAGNSPDEQKALWSDPDSSAPARIMVTSGTEGVPKMVRYHHDALTGGIANQLTVIGGDSSMRLFLLPPISSGFGSLATFGVIARHGATLVITETFDPANVLTLLEHHRVTILCAVPAMAHMLLATGRVTGADTSSLRVIYLAGAPIPEVLVERAMTAFRCSLVSAYGCSDGAFCCTRPDDPPDKIATTIGRPTPMVCSLKVAGPDGSELTPGETGEIWARGPMSPLAYHNSPDLDRRYRDPEGWTRTGDLGVFDADGYLRVVDRLKDIIIRGGFNISPAEVEADLIRHPAVSQAACVGVPDERLGERTCACITLRPEATEPTLEEVRAFLAQRGLAKNKLPDELRVITAMPTNPVGKVMRRELRTLTNASRDSQRSGRHAGIDR
jgi:non-ribosomal peptide synthetase component E (peptide arylation enzyme)